MKSLLYALIFASLLFSCTDDVTTTLDPDPDPDPEVENLDPDPEPEEENFDPTIREYYINSLTGDDANDGTTSDNPIKTLTKLEKYTLLPGSTIYLARGGEYPGQISLVDIEATLDEPVVVTSYGDESSAQPIVDAAGYLAGVLIENSSNISISDIAITANGSAKGVDSDARNESISISPDGVRCGVYCKVSKSGDYSNIALDGLTVYDIFLEDEGYDRDDDDVNSANGTEGYGWGILFFNSDTSSTIDGVSVSNCDISNVAHTGVKFVGTWAKTITNIEVAYCNVTKAGGPALQSSSVKYVHIHHCVVDNAGSTSDTRKWGRGSGYWPWNAQEVLLEYCTLMNCNGPADSAGAHIDYNCSDVIFQYNFSMNNESFIEILGNNYGTCYRYNVSVNDGQRTKGVDGNTQNGYSVWISGYNGSDPFGPYRTYIYNNTIYVAEGLISRNSFAETLGNMLIQNNIFYVEGEALADLSATTNDETPSGTVLFSNNLFLDNDGGVDGNDSWASDSTLFDTAPKYGDAQFVNAGGDQIADYTPTNSSVVSNQGVEVVNLSSISSGASIWLGLEVAEDILGNPIVGLPDMGAIELQ